MNNIILSCENLSKKFGNIVAVDRVTYEFESSHFYAIKGASGAGKSTFLQVLGLLEDCDKGSVYIDGEDILKLSSKKKASYRQNYFGFVFQSCFLNASFTSLENLMIPMLLSKNIDQARSDAEELLKKVGLYDRKDCYPKQLSGGEQQRIAVVRALANSPKCILADEPTGNLDEENEKIVFMLLKEYATQHGRTVICVTHSDKISKYADSMLFYKKGELFI